MWKPSKGFQKAFAGMHWTQSLSTGRCWQALKSPLQGLQKAPDKYLQETFDRSVEGLCFATGQCRNTIPFKVFGLKASLTLVLMCCLRSHSDGLLKGLLKRRKRPLKQFESYLADLWKTSKWLEKALAEMPWKRFYRDFKRPLKETFKRPLTDLLKAYGFVTGQCRNTIYFKVFWRHL